MDFLHTALLAVGRAARVGGEYLLAIVTSRSLVVISSTCAILYGGFWLVAVLQANGLISTNLPVPVADAVILNRAGGRLSPAAVSQAQKSQRAEALADAAQASGSPAPGTETSPLTLEVQSAPPVALWVLDDHGGHLGADPQTGLVRLQIAGAKYSGLGSNPQLVSIPHATGKYQIQLFGTANGSYTVTVRVFEGDDINNATQYAGTGQIFQDTLLEADATVSLDANNAPHLDLSPVQVLVAGQAPSPSISPSASASPSASPSESPSVSASPAPSSQTESVDTNPPAPVIVPAGPATVVRPRPAPKPPLPLLPVPTLPQQAVNAIAPPPSNVPSPAYGTSAHTAPAGQTDLGLRVPTAILKQASNG